MTCLGCDGNPGHGVNPELHGDHRSAMTTTALRAAWSPACTKKGDVYLEAYAALDRVLKAHGYRPRAGVTGAYNCRKITGGTGYSLHSYGPGDAFAFWNGVTIATSLAVDINWDVNPYGPKLVTDMPRAMVDDVLRIRTRNGAQVWRWGGDYRTNKDAMHFEIVCDPHDLGTGIDKTTHPQPTPTEDDMTPEQAAQLAETNRKVDVLYSAFIGDDKALVPKPGAFRRLFQLFDSRTWGLADKAGVKPNPKV